MKRNSFRRTESKRLYNINNKQTNEFADHFSTLLNCPRIQADIEPYVIEAAEDETTVFSSVDIAKAIDALKIGKSTDPYDVGAYNICR